MSQDGVSPKKTWLKHEPIANYRKKHIWEFITIEVRLWRIPVVDKDNRQFIPKK